MLSRVAGLRRVGVLARPSGMILPAVGQQVRHLNLHEFQSKELMNRFSINTQKFRMAKDRDSALVGAKELIEKEGADELVVKAQVFAGGRGKGHFDNGYKGGVHVLKTPNEAAESVSKMVGARLVTKQTPPDGVPVNQVMIAKSVDIKSEKYFALLMDRAHDGPVAVVSKHGGMDIEEVAEKTPNEIHTFPLKLDSPIPDDTAREIATVLGFASEHVPEAMEQVRNLYEMFKAVDATQVEINPLAEVVDNGDGNLMAVDAKIGFDDNAAFRQQEIFAMHDPSEDDPRETEAGKYGLNYIGMEGNIACMVNGAGLAMATMDIIKLHGGEPANFLDVGGGADEQQVTEAFKILTADPRVKAILVNIFGGIMRCDVIAQGVIAAAKQVGLNVPLVVRLAGTNVDLGKKLLDESGLNIVPADDLDDAAKKAVAMIK